MNTVRLIALSALVISYSMYPAQEARVVNACPSFVAAPAIVLAATLLAPKPQPQNPIQHNQKSASKALVSNNHCSRHHPQASAKHYCKRGNYKHGKTAKG